MNPDVFLFGVADGHGFYGREASTLAKNKYPNFLAAHPSFLIDNREAIVDSVEKTNAELRMAEFDCDLSGSTFVTVLISGYKLWCGNTGDSRALMAR
jgi:serine/threonine protein phosphatase PrpC